MKKFESVRCGVAPPRVSVDDPVRVVAAALAYFIINDSKIKLTRWIDLLQRLGELLDLPDERICEGCLGVLHKVCRDYSKETGVVLRNDQLTDLVPKCLKFFRHSNPRLRYCAITFISLLFIDCKQAAVVHADAFVTNLLQLALDTDYEVQKAMCRALALLLEYHIDCLIPHMCCIVEYVMNRMQDAEEDVAVEARATLFCLAKPICKEALTPHFSSLVHILLNGTKYCDTAAERLKQVIPGTIQNPGSIYRGRESIDYGLVSGTKVPLDNILYARNLRTSSAIALGAISTVFNEELLTLLRPIIRQMLKDKDWVIMESAIYVLGIIAEGCHEGMAPYLPHLIPLFYIHLRSHRAAVRSAACWTLSRYCPWVLRQPRHLYLKPLLEQLLEKVLDEHEMVQEVACNSLISVEECAETELVPYLNSILDTLYSGFLKYRRSRFYMLYNVIEVLADSVPSEIRRREFIQYFIRLLTEDPIGLEDSQINMFHLLRCQGSLATALKSDFLPYHLPVVNRCIRTAHLGRQGFLAKAIHLQYSITPEKPLTIAALKTLTKLAECLGRDMEPSLSSTSIVELMVDCAKDSVPEVRQATFNFLGTFVKICPKSLSTKASFLVPLLIENLNNQITPLCNSATYAIRELAMTLRADVKPYVYEIRAKLTTIINSPRTSESLRVDTTVAIGYLGHIFPYEMAPALCRFIVPCCSAIGKIPDGEVKNLALRGIFTLVSENPAGALRYFITLLDTIIAWIIRQDDLKQAMNNLIRLYKQCYGTTRLHHFYEKLPPALRQRVLGTYDF